MKKKVKSLVRTYRATKRLNDDLLNAVHINEDEEKLHNAKRLHANIYRSINFVDDSDIINGVIHQGADPHQHHSFYFGVYNKESGKLLASARQIEAKSIGGLRSFPVLQNTRVDVDHLNKLRSVRPSSIVEVSALVKQRGVGTEAVLYLFRAMLERSITEGHEYWIMALDTNYHKSLKSLFGKTYQKMGDVTSYKGGDVLPCMLSPKAALAHFTHASRIKNIVTFGANKRIATFFADIEQENSQ